MAVALAMVLSAASFLLVYAAGPGRAAGGAAGAAAAPVSAAPGLAAEHAVTLAPQERAELRRGRIVLRTLPPDGRKGRTYDAFGLLQGSLDEAAAVLTDFERYPEFMPNVSSVRVCERAAPCSVVETSLHLPLGVRKRYRLRYTGRQDETGFLLSWEMMPWPELKASQTIADTAGFWFVQPYEEGGLLVRYRVYSDPGHVPLGLKGIAQSVAKDKIPDGIVRLRARIRDLFRPPIRASRP